MPKQEILRILDEVKQAWWDNAYRYGIPPERFGTYKVFTELEDKIFHELRNSREA